MKFTYIIEYTFEKEDGSVRHESFEYPQGKDINRFRLSARPRKGETIIRFSGQLCPILI